jgi:hypothetical protein
MRARQLVVCLSAVALCGCAGWFMVGSQSSSGVPAKAAATYKVPTCTVVADGSTIGGPATQTYYLEEGAGALVLHELDGRGSGAAITNHWADDAGDHFLTYVKTSHGWEYLVPVDRSQPGTRLAYQEGTFHVDRVDGVLKVTSGEPIARCVMVPQ